jgi:hypothetical protein
MMVAVAIVAILLSLPTPALVLIGIFGTILAVMVLAPAGIAPPRRRIEAACWSFALHPLLILVWLLLWRFTVIRQPLYSTDNSPLYGVILEIPYIMAVLSLLYLPIFAVLGWISSALGFPRRLVSEWRDSLSLIFILAPIIWLVTFLTLLADPFELYVWVRD